MAFTCDPNSFANFDTSLPKSFHLELEADFEKQVLSGFVDVNCVAQVDEPKTLVLDVRTLDIKKATLKDTELTFTISSPNETVATAVGSALTINLPAGIKKGDAFTVRVEYATTPQSAAIQWLRPEQTCSKTHPYLFTQCQAIHARSLLPCQDTPSVKTSYTAKIRCAKPLVALMSAVGTASDAASNESSNVNTYNFEQRIPIPSYLIALVIGALASKEIGPRTAVWCEPEMLEEAAFEFADTEKYIQTAESFLTPYEWGRYDLLVLPPSFPFGGMENPCLTFVTPTLLAGDRSLTLVVAHEIAHSWSGNLVTNKNWEHFWLNEGFTVFIERRILAHLTKDEKDAEFEALLGYIDLEESVQHYGYDHNFTALLPKLESMDPDDAFSSVPYEKGFNFLYYLCKLVGGFEVFEAFLRAYFQHFKYQSISTDDMKAFFLQYFSDKVSNDVLQSIEWDKWLTSPGMPHVAPNFDTTRSEASIRLADRWATQGAEGASADDIAGWKTKQMVYFLAKLAEKPALPHSVLDAMNEIYQMDKVRNAEIRAKWQLLCLKAHYTAIFPQVVDFLTSQGRMKFVRPIYRALYAAGADGKKLAVATFREHHGVYHGIASKMLLRDLEIDASTLQ